MEPSKAPLSTRTGSVDGKPPMVSVVIPCYNLGQYIAEAVHSVFAQTYQDFEVVVVNDGSTDPETNTIITSLHGPRITVLTTENRGLPAARNRAIQHARGKYICALDADDKLHPSFLEKTIGVLERDPSVAFVSTWLECFGTESWVWRQERCDFPKLLAECVVLTASPVRRDAVDAVGGYDCEHYLYGSEDWDLWISLVEKGFRGVVVPEVLFYYRQREGSMRRIADRGEIRLRVWQSLLSKHRESYRRFASDVLLLKEDDCGRLLFDNWILEHDLETRLKPLITVPQETIALEAAAHDEHVMTLRQALDAAHTEVSALRSSWSWKITSPLRAAYEIWLAVARFFTSARRRQPRM
jgi:glycosyltransferase involved in cell wall biosynthesis